MSHKYGYRDFPRSIAADEFEKLISGVKDEDSKEMLLRLVDIASFVAVNGRF